MDEVGVRPAAFKDVEAMRRLYREDARCQIIHDSALSRGIADPFLIFAGDRVAGYAGVWNRYHAGRLMEYFVLPSARHLADSVLREVLRVTAASHVEAQTNMAAMHELLLRTARNIRTEKLLFADAGVSRLVVPGSNLRPAKQEDVASECEWVLEVDGRIVGAGGILCHYNPPYGDIYMEVRESARRKGFGAFLVQELKRICTERGKVPAARCDPDNLASRRTLEKAGFELCGRLQAGACGWLRRGRS